MAYSFRVVNSGLVQTVADHRLPNTQVSFFTFKFLKQFSVIILSCFKFFFCFLLNFVQSVFKVFFII